MSIPLANYQNEQNQFQKLLEPHSRQRILMFQGESGSGKSTLLGNCKSGIPAHVPHITIDLKGRSLTIEQIFYRLGHRAGWQKLTAVTRQVASWQENPDAHSQPDWQSGLRDHLNQVLTTSDPAQKWERQAIITERWFEDAQKFDVPFLLVVDTYEKASTELDLWFGQHFLPWIAESNPVRVLVAGQRLPERSIEWVDYSQQMELRGVAEARLWLPVAEAMERLVSLEYLAGACAALQGNPAAIRKFIEMLPRANGHLQLTSTTSSRLDRRQFLQQLDSYFDGNDLNILCFYLNLSYKDDLSGDTKQTRLAALIELIERQHREEEFIALLREERPGASW